MSQRRNAMRALAGLLAAGVLVLMGGAPAQATTTHAGGQRVHAPNCDTGWNGT